MLDLGCGDGTTALPAARRGADVLGVDIASNLVAAGNKRARVEGLANCTFQEGDASDLNELADVMGNWIPNDPTLVAQILRISAAYSRPSPEGFVSPITWGVEENVLERFGGAGIPEEQVSFSRETYRFVYPAPPTALLAAFRSYYGPTMNAFEAAEATDRADELQDELEAVFKCENTSPDDNTTSIPATFLRVSVAV